MNEDYTLKARWVDLRVLKFLISRPCKPQQTTVKCSGVHLGHVAWRCVDQMLTATHRVDGVSAMLVRKEIHKTAVFLG